MEKYNFKDNSDLKNNTAENLFDDSDIQACSATDCTGLIPALPQDEWGSMRINIHKNMIIADKFLFLHCIYTHIVAYNCIS